MAAALYWRRERLLRGGFWLLLLLVLAEVAGVLLLCYWAYSLGAIPAERLNQVRSPALSRLLPPSLTFSDLPLACARS